LPVPWKKRGDNLVASVEGRPWKDDVEKEDLLLEGA